MQRSTRSLSKKPSAPTSRTVLYVDSDDSYAAALHGAWRQMGLEDDLHIVLDKEAALHFLKSAPGKNRQCPLAAVVLDPDATGEETGPFLRELRTHFRQHIVPIVFWSQDSDKYKVLEGRGVDSVLKKPMVLGLIQALDAACRLRVPPFRPFSLAHPKPSQISE